MKHGTPIHTKLPHSLRTSGSLSSNLRRDGWLHLVAGSGRAKGHCYHSPIVHSLPLTHLPSSTASPLCLFAACAGGVRRRIAHEFRPARTAKQSIPVLPFPHWDVRVSSQLVLLVLLPILPIFAPIIPKTSFILKNEFLLLDPNRRAR